MVDFSVYFFVLVSIFNFVSCYAGVQACSYPGTAIAGRMSSVKFYYAIGESITFTCDAGLDLRGAKMLKCLRNGKWSNAIPTCVNPDATGHRGSDGKDHY